MISSIPVVVQRGGWSYVHGPAGLISATDGSGNDSYFLSDGLGSTRVLTDSGGVVVAGYRYDAFGSVRGTSGTVSTEFRYTGEQWDSALGYSYLRARYYDPALGRFVSRDPIDGYTTDPLSLNRYSYVQNRATMARDPTGLRTHFIGGIGGSDDRSFEDFVAALEEAGIRDVRGPVAAYDNTLHSMHRWWGGVFGLTRSIQPRNTALVAGRSIGSSSDDDARALADRVLDELATLEPGEQLNFVALSGGATTAFNAARLIKERRPAVTIHNIVTLGGVHLNTDRPSNVETIVRVRGVPSWKQLPPDAPVEQWITGRLQSPTDLGDPIELMAVRPVQGRDSFVPLRGVGHFDYIGNSNQQKFTASILHELHGLR